MLPSQTSRTAIPAVPPGLTLLTACRPPPAFRSAKLIALAPRFHGRRALPMQGSFRVPPAVLRRGPLPLPGFPCCGETHFPPGSFRSRVLPAVAGATSVGAPASGST
eukprot:2399256-Heterocapsa_arctica.AAC.1